MMRFLASAVVVLACAQFGGTEDEDMGAGTPARFPGAVGVAASKNSLQRMSGKQDEKYGRVLARNAPLMWTVDPHAQVAISSSMLATQAYLGVLKNVVTDATINSYIVPGRSRVAPGQTATVKVALYTVDGDDQTRDWMLRAVDGGASFSDVASIGVGTCPVQMFLPSPLVLDPRNTYVVGVTTSDEGIWLPYMAKSNLASPVLYIGYYASVGATNADLPKIVRVSQLTYVEETPMVIVPPMNQMGFKVTNLAGQNITSVLY